MLTGVQVEESLTGFGVGSLGDLRCFSVASVTLVGVAQRVKYSVWVPRLFYHCPLLDCSMCVCPLLLALRIPGLHGHCDSECSGFEPARAFFMCLVEVPKGEHD